MLVTQILKAKGEAVFTISPGETVQGAAALLVERRVGALVVLDANDSVVGMVSERDLVRVVAREGAAGLSKPISACMTAQVLFADLDDTVDDLMARMTDRRVRHFPVVRDGRLVGLVSIGDMVKAKIAETEAEAEGLKSYIAGS